MDVGGWFRPTAVIGLAEFVDRNLTFEPKGSESQLSTQSGLRLYEFHRPKAAVHVPVRPGADMPRSSEGSSDLWNLNAIGGR